MYRTDKQFMKNPATAASRIYIGSLAKQVIADDLESKFKGHGKILGLVLNSGFAFIQFENENEVQSACKSENGSILYGRKIIVKQANMDKSKAGGNQNIQGPQRQSGPPSNVAPQNQQQKPTLPTPSQLSQPPKLSNPPPQKTPPPPQALLPTPPPQKITESDRALKFQPPERESAFQDESMEDDRPNIRPPPGPQHTDDRGRKNDRKVPPRGGGDNRNNRDNRDNRDNRSGGRPNERERFMDRFEPPPQNIDMYRDPYFERGDRDYIVPPAPRTGQYIPPLVSAVVPPEKNDCEIIVVSKALTEYAEFIEQKLKTLGLIVDLLFPNEDVPIGKVLANISSRGCLYAILVMPQNEENRSLTLNILHGIAQEHRNMPIDDALILMSRDFEAYMKGEQLPPESDVQLVLNDRHPTPMQMMLNLLSENRHMSSSQYDKLIKYLEERRELQREFEVAEGIQPDSQESDTKQAELQSRIMNILNKSNDAPIPTSITAPEPPAQNKAPILKDPTVQKALDSLIMGDMFKSMTGAN